MTNKFVLINSYSQKNVGDAAILNSTVELISGISNLEIIVSTRYYKEDHGLSNNIKVFPPIIRFAAPGEKNDILRMVEFLIDSIFMFSLGFFYQFFPKIARHVLHFFRPKLGKFLGIPNHIVIASGGGYFYSNQKTLNLSFLHSAFSIIVAKLFNHEIVMMPQSIGPIRKKMDAYVLKKSLNLVKQVIVREAFSKEYVDKLLGIDAVICPDIVFTKYPIMNSQISNYNVRIRIVVMDWTWANKVTRNALENYIVRMSTLVDLLHSKGYDVVIGGHSFIPEQHQNDIEMAMRIAERTVNKVKISHEIGLTELYAEYASSHLVVSTRLHGAIMAMSQGTPSLVLGYQPKARGTFRLLNIEHLFLDVQTAEVSEIMEAIKFLEAEWQNILPTIQKISFETREFLSEVLKGEASI